MAQTILDIVQQRGHYALGDECNLLGQFCGRVAKRCLAIITQHGMAVRAVNCRMQHCNLFAGIIICSCVVALGIPMRCSSTWHLFTDAQHEPEASEPFSGIGAVLVNESGQKVRFFSEQLPSELIYVNVTGRKTIFSNVNFLLYSAQFWFGRN